MLLIIRLIIHTIRQSPSRADQIDDASNVSRPDPTEPTRSTQSTRLRIWRLGVRILRGAPFGFHRCHGEARAGGAVRGGSRGGRSHREVWVGCMVWSTTASR